LLEQTSICVVDNAGAIIWRGKCRSTPESIYTVVAKHASGAVRIGLETGQLSTWLFHELRARQLPVMCIDARHAKAPLSLQINKADANDAHGIAQIVRVGWYRQIGVKSMDTHAIRAMLVARAQLVTQKVKLTNCIRGLLKTFGIVLGVGKGRRFETMVREQIAENPMLITIIEPMLVALLTTREQLAVFDRLVRRRARATTDDGPRRRSGNPAGLYHHGRRSGALQAIVFGRGLSRSDAAAFSIRRDGPRRSRCGDAMLRRLRA